MDGSDGVFSASGDRKQDKVLLEPFTHIIEVPGKMIRGKLVKAFNHWMCIPEEKMIAITEIIHMLHNASLLVDDIEDNSVLRRGIAVAHSIYGVASTINSANYVYFIGLERILALQHPKATAVFCEQMLELHRGQGMEIHWRDSYTCPSEKEYNKMTMQKTGGLFDLAIRLMQLFSDSQKDYTKLTGILGLYFQIRDDYANLCMKEYSDNKTFCEDLTEGKFGFPVIHAITNHPDDHQIINIIRQRPKDLEVKRYCVNLLNKLGSFAYTRETLRQLESEANSEIQQLGGNPYLEKVMEELRNWENI